MFRLLIVLALLALAGCVDTRPHLPDRLAASLSDKPQAVAAHTKVVRENHAGRTDIKGPIVELDQPYNRVGYIFWVCRDADGDTYHLQVVGGFPKRVYLKNVYSNGRELPSKVVDRERTRCGNDCTTVETVGLEFNRADVERYATEGLSLEVHGRRDRIALSIPAGYFRAVVDLADGKARVVGTGAVKMQSDARPGESPPSGPKRLLAG